MKDTPIILSISMLVSGREEMEKSLDSLHFFREAFPCELILVDTGCNPAQRAIAEKYADKIVNFTWCNDFAAARNAGLKEARGEWFMYIDDDEWFEDPQQIVAFFTSGEYKNYKSATYIQRNYRDLQGTMYVDNYPSRMVKLTPETKFVGRIHEYLEPYEKPKKEFTDFVHHYGYVYKDAEEQRRHAQRNILPLLEMKKEHPGEPRWVCQLAQEYLTIQEYEEILKVCREGLKEWQEQVKTGREDFAYVPAHLGGLYVYLLIALEVLKRYEEEEKWLKKAFADPNMLFENMQPTLAFLCVLGAKLYMNLKDYKQCRGYLRRYIDYAKRLKEDRAMLESGAALIVTSVFQELFMYDSILSCLEAAVRTEDHELVEEAFYMLDWQSSDLLNKSAWEERLLDAFCSVEYHPSWVKLLQTLVSRPGGEREMLAVFENIESTYKQQGGAVGGKKLSRLHRMAAELNCEHSYILGARILEAKEKAKPCSEEERRQKIAAMFGELFEKYGDQILGVGAEVWNVAERYDISLGAYLLQVDYRSWKRMLERWCRTASLWEIRQWEERLSVWKTNAQEARRLLHFELFDIKCAEGYLHCHEEACPGLEKMGEMLWRYADSVLAMYQPCIKEFVLTEMPEALPDEIQLALELKRLQRYLEQGNDLKSLESVKKCLGLCPALENELASYAKMLRDEVKKHDREASEARLELRYLIATLKRTAKQQIESGEYQAAREILQQVRQCAPEDEEVETLIKQIDERIQK